MSANEQAANAEFNRRADTIDLGIETGEVTSREQILSAGLREEDAAKLLRRFDERNKEDNQARATLSALSGGDEGAKINPFDADQVKKAENAWRYLKQVSDPDQMEGLSASFVQSSGYIPRDMQADLRRGVASKGVGNLSAAMAQADALQKAAPTAFDNFAGGDDVRQKLAVYRTYVNDLGMSGEEAAQRMLAAETDTSKRSREMLKTDAKAFVKDLSVNDVTDSFDTAFTWEPGAGISPVTSNALLAEYKAASDAAKLRAWLAQARLCSRPRAFLHGEDARKKHHREHHRACPSRSSAVPIGQPRGRTLRTRPLRRDGQ